jgi:hypothetical protein
VTGRCRTVSTLSCAPTPPPPSTNCTAGCVSVGDSLRYRKRKVHCVVNGYAWDIYHNRTFEDCFWSCWNSASCFKLLEGGVYIHTYTDWDGDMINILSWGNKETWYKQSKLNDIWHFKTVRFRVPSCVWWQHVVYWIDTSVLGRACSSDLQRKRLKPGGWQ